MEIWDSVYIHNNKEEKEPQGESTHPYPNYPGFQAAPEGHHEIMSILVFDNLRMNLFRKKIIDAQLKAKITDGCKWVHLTDPG